MAETCDKCRYWEHPNYEESPDVGVCHRYPPERSDPEFIVADHYQGPHTHKRWWCGEFAAR